MSCRWCKGTGKIALATSVVDCEECTPTTNPCAEIELPGYDEATKDIIDYFNKCKAKAPIPPCGSSTFVAQYTGWYSAKAAQQHGWCEYQGPNGPVQITEVTEIGVKSYAGWPDLVCVGEVGEFIGRFGPSSRICNNMKGYQ